MGNLLQATVSIQGTRPLLFNHLHPSPEFGQRQERSGTAGNDPTEWQRSVLAMPETRQLYLLPSYIFGCLRDAGRFTKRNRGNLVSAIASTLTLSERRILLDRYLPETPQFYSEDADAPTYVFMSITGGMSKKGAKNVRYRVAVSSGWRCQFLLDWDKTIVSRSELEAVAIDAGKLVGLGDGRSIGYGRFEMLQFEVTQE
ncbi:MAG TPA: hypothetical protein V6C84_24895 [Coleofasciculaceae cyanobacterium]|jgi:hypothetical protein